jgi:tetratricopeptide (TPR) repeat protein
LTIFFTQLKRIVNKQSTSQQRLIAAIGIFFFTAYFIDATFNFPVERTIMQVNFAFMASLIFLIPSTSPQKKSFETTFFFLPALLFAGIAIMINNQVFDSMKGQKLFSGDMDKDIAQIPDLEYDFPTYPQLSYNSIPIDAIMSRYAFKKNDYETAIRMLDKASKQNPYIHYSEFAKAGMYYKMNQPDSGYKYAKLAFEYKPRSFSAYKNWLYGSVQKRDTTAIDSAFALYTRYRNETRAWVEYFNASMVVKQRANQRLIALADSALKYFPDSVNLFTNMKNNFLASLSNPVRNVPVVSQEMVQIAQKNLEQATIHFNQKQYALAAKEYLVTANIDVTNYVHMENVAICYYSMSNFDQAIRYFNKAIAVSGNAAGKSYYYKGVSEISLGKKEQGCATIKTAMSKGFSGDPTYNKTNCNF